MAAAAVAHFTPGMQRTPRTPVTGTVDFISPARRRKRDAPLLLSAQNTLPENDDVAEKKRRFISSVTGMDLQSPAANSPRSVSRLTDSERSGSSSVNNARLTECYAKCIQLSAENKINHKNAFSLDLIDMLQDVVKSNQRGEVTNFQVASCSLDAGGKIYAGRVDSIHHQTFKMLGGLGRTENNQEDEDEDQTTTKKKTRKEKQHKPGCTIESNIASMNLGKVDLEFEVDPVFSSMSDSVFEEGGLSSCFLNSLQSKLNDELLIDSNQAIGTLLDDPCTAGETTKQFSTLDPNTFKGLYERLTSSAPAQICPYFADFNFTNWDSTEQDDFHLMAVNDCDETRAPAFDMDGSVTELPPDVFIDAGDDNGCGDDYDDFEEMDGDMGHDGCRNEVNNNITLAFVNGAQAVMLPPGENRPVDAESTGPPGSDLYLEMSTQPSDYSYFGAEALATWAGPEHWKLKQRLSKLKDASSAGSSQEPKQRRKREKFYVDFQTDTDHKKAFSKSRAATVLAKSTLVKMCERNITLPDSSEEDEEMIFKFSLKPQIKLRRQNLAKEVPVDADAEWYNYDNPKDQQNFCPDLQVDDGDDSFCGGSENFGQDNTCDFSQANSGIGNDTYLDQTALGNDDLVAQPNRVEKIDINYSKTAKRLNVKKLKHCMWNILNENQEDKEKQLAGEENVPVVNDSEPEKEKKSLPVGSTFSEMYRSLPSKISGQMAKNLSVPIAFVCLLHLANEKTLKIQGTPDMSDFLIEQEEGSNKSVSNMAEIVGHEV